MAGYSINRGIGRPVEFKGLRSQYLFIFAGGLLAVFVAFVVIYMVGINQWICIGFGCISALVLVYLTFTLNDKRDLRTYEAFRTQKSPPLYHQSQSYFPIIHL